MFPDNAAEDTETSDPTPAEILTREFASMTDRELLEYIARNMAHAVAIAGAVQEQVSPVMDKLSKNPLLGGFFR